MIKVGQIYKKPNNNLFVVSYTNESEYHILYSDGYTASYYYNETSCLSLDTLIAEYSTWIEAINSKEFKGEQAMTWKELKEKAIKNGYRLDDIDCCFEVIREPIGEEISKSFYKDGDIFIDGTQISRERTPDQMYQIMLALR